MNRLLLLLAMTTGTSVAARPSPQAATPEVEAILAAHLAARGGVEAIRAIDTLVYSEGTYVEGNFVSPGDSFMAYKRPHLRLVGDPARPGGFMEGYDGSSWEWFANPGVVLRTVGAASGAIRRGAVFEGPFLGYRERGSTIVLGEPQEFAGRPAHRLTVTMRDGFVSDYFLDQETHLVVASRSTAPVHAFGADVTSESRFADYRPVGGVLFPHEDVSVEIATGEVLSSMIWGKIDANRELPTAWFSPPEFQRNELQGFLEKLFLQRTDEKAVLWSYVDFRLASPGVSTRAGVEFIGYHMLKMGSVNQAIALLDANARDHPRSSSAACELGRAHSTAGDIETARWWYEKALMMDVPDERAEEALEALD